MTFYHNLPVTNYSFLPRFGYSTSKHKLCCSVDRDGQHRSLLLNCHGGGDKVQAINLGTSTITKVPLPSTAVADGLSSDDVRYVPPQSPFHTGGMDITTSGATSSLIGGQLALEKHIVIVRHGLTTWNAQGRIQGSSDVAELTPMGVAQALRCRDAVSRIPFDSCFSSPIRRARTTAELLWAGREGPLVLLDALKEAHLGYLQGMRNADAAVEYAEEFRCWRERPASFCINGRFPVADVYAEARRAWAEILLAEGSVHLVVTHKSILRALVCVALGLPPTAFRAVDINNGGINVFKVNRRGEPMVTGLNNTAHMFTDGVYY